MGHEDDELKPYVEPLPDYKDPRRTGEALGWDAANQPLLQCRLSGRQLGAQPLPTSLSKAFLER